MFISNEYSDYIAKNQSINPYPKGGSTGIYITSLAEMALVISSGALKLFLLIAADINEYGQTGRSRDKFNTILKIKKDRARMSKLMKELIDMKMISMFGTIITVNPFIVMPKTANPKIKATLQDAWLDMVEFV